MKHLSLILICSLLSCSVFAQNRTVFFDEYYAQLPDKTGATYKRVFYGVDSLKTTYEVREYTADDQLIFISHSSNKKLLRQEGSCTWYNSHGDIIKTGFYEKSIMIMVR